MNNYWLFLRNLLWPTCLAVLLGATIAGLGFILFAGLATMGSGGETTNPFFTELFSYWLLISISASVFGLLPALLLGAPLYAYLAYKRWLSPLSLLLSGVAPGLVLWVFSDFKTARIFCIFGCVVACTLHVLARHDVRTLQNAMDAHSA
ncbi:hypothetical protein E9531_15785 [Lampropedia puyangensis]|uniref:Uncharacterized protein n=1 Tax=Lampropedia puyangensis TaxID=1330072 RepID=A0A4S8EV64_9BURK|nr:hypothetical protein [Lampropedia puyangensis]THT97594.1 hypothetical protein E9531_15785 [Lampropedia puyangensis]